MATRAIRRKRDDTMLTEFEHQPERAPSAIRAETPTFARFLGLVGLFGMAVGAVAMLAPLWEKSYIFGPDLGAFFFSIGLSFVLLHAFAERDLQFRRIYGLAALALTGVCVAFRVLPLGGSLGALFIPYGIPGLFLSLLLIVSVARHETEPAWRSFYLFDLGALGALMIAAGALVGFFNENFLTGEGILLMILGLLYFAAFVSLQDTFSNVTYRAGVALGLFGLAVFVAALFVSWRRSEFLIPAGWTLMSFGLVFAVIAVGIISDLKLIVLVRRELATFFFSPVAYIVLFGIVLIGWINFYFFVSRIIDFGGRTFEPIVGEYLVNIFAVFLLMFVVPVITMRLLSEEQRTGTLEVLLTAPVNESTVVLSKFFAALIFYLVTWSPFFLYLVALRVMGGQEFDYRPLLGFFLALTATGAGFVSIGLFFSSLTRNQIIAAVLTFVVLMGLLGAFMIRRMLSPGNPLGDLLTYMSFVDLWWESLRGQFAPRFLVFHVSTAVFFLFVTLKVLESRKWK